MSEETLYTVEGVHNEESGIGEEVQEVKPGAEGETRTDEGIMKGASEVAEAEAGESGPERAVREKSGTGEVIEEKSETEEGAKEKPGIKEAVEEESEQVEMGKNDPEAEEIAAEQSVREEEDGQYEASGEKKIEIDDADTEENIDKGEGVKKMEEQDWNMTADEGKPELEFAEEEPKKRGFFRRSREEANFLRDKWILSRIRDEDLMEYLILEQKRNEQLQKARDVREKRIISAFKLSVSLAAGVAVVYLLKDNPTIFVNILYIGGILGGFHFWKNSREK